MTHHQTDNMQNDKTSTLLADLENLSSELDNLSNTPSTADAALNDEDAVAVKEPQAAADDLAPNLDSMIEAIVQQALPALAEQLTQQLEQQSQETIAALYQQAQ